MFSQEVSKNLTKENEQTREDAGGVRAEANQRGGGENCSQAAGLPGAAGSALQRDAAAYAPPEVRASPAGAGRAPSRPLLPQAPLRLGVGSPFAQCRGQGGLRAMWVPDSRAQGAGEETEQELPGALARRECPGRRPRGKWTQSDAI